MKKIIYCLIGLIMAVSAEASHTEGLRIFSDVYSHQSFCSSRCEVLKDSIEKSISTASNVAVFRLKAEQLIADIKTKILEEKTTDFSLPIITNCQTDHYSFFGTDFIRTKLSSETEILFPINGRQMSFEEVVQLSGANLDDGLVTKFYMAAFGLIQWERQYLKMGFNERNQVCRIFDLSRLDKKTRRVFTTNFRKIASNSVGRTLLYRLLIEIRRTDVKQKRCIEDSLQKISTTNDLDKRNACMNIKIIIPYSTGRNSFNQRKKTINFYPSKDMKETNALGNKSKDKIEIIKTSRPDDVGLFHEMLHWFHTLRAPERKKRETTLKHLPTNYQSDISLKSREIGTDKLSMWAYKNPFGSSEKLVIEIEEFRTIMGYVPTICLKTGKLETVLYPAEENIYGDELSENLYRKCIGQPLRYGHLEAISGDYISKELADNINIFYEHLIKQGQYKTIKH